jgi:hypothetical protein
MMMMPSLATTLASTVRTKRNVPSGIGSDGGICSIQQDIYLALKKLLGNCIMLSNLFNQVTTETSNCAYTN